MGQEEVASLPDTPAKLKPELARAYLEEDLAKVRDQKMAEQYEWKLEPDFEDLKLQADLWSFDERGAKLDDYHAVLDMSYYRTWPPGVTFVNPETMKFDPVKDLMWLPKVAQKPEGLDIQFHPNYGYPNGVAGQLVCNSMVLEYYESSHNPTPVQRWNPSTNNFGTTLHTLQIVLRKPYYGGPSEQRVQVVEVSK